MALARARARGWHCEAIVMLNEVKHLDVSPWNIMEMFRFAQHDNALTA
jgi:hypothetical protein